MHCRGQKEPRKRTHRPKHKESLFLDRRALITALLLLGIATTFWAGSRYPALNEKVLMGGETQLSGLGFSTLVEVETAHPLYLQILINALNWAYTNRQGMTFGLLFAAGLMTLFSLFRRSASSNRLSNSLLGLLMGAPLGVCVNCATPIAQGIYASGGRVETMLAAMISSPTLNVVVLTMLVSLFPLYMVTLKVGLTAGFVLVGIPLLTRWLPVKKLSLDERSDLTPRSMEVFSGRRETGEGAVNWWAAITWVGLRYLVNLWVIVKATLPLMVLAGLLGSAAITMIPFESLPALIPSTGLFVTLVAMAGIGLLGTFLPVPMAFDVIITAVLLQAGLPVKFAMVLLFTLGIFSIYPFLLIWKNISREIAVGIFSALVLLGVVAGVGGNLFEQWETQRLHQRAIEYLPRFTDEPPQPRVDRTVVGMEGAGLIAELQAHKLEPAHFVPLKEENGLVVQRMPFQPRLSTPGPRFRLFDGSDFGLQEHDDFSVLKGLEPWKWFRGIAAGDVHNDGWIDVVLTSHPGLGLYANRGGRGYERQKIALPLLNEVFVTNTALVDFDNDGWLDLFFATLRRGNYVLYNQAGNFPAENLVELPNQPDAIMTAATTFGDVDQDGDLDIFIGNWLPPPHSTSDAPPLRDVWLENDDDGFVLHTLDGFPGEALSALFTDFNNDGSLDLLVGNDRATPDSYYLGDGKGNFRWLKQSDGLFPYTTKTTMSLTTADIDNNLVPEIFAAQIATGGMNGVQDLSGDQVCAELVKPMERKRCQERLGFTGIFFSRNGVGDCLGLGESQRRDCISFKLVRESFLQRRQEDCDHLPANWTDLAFMCRLTQESYRPDWAHKLRAAYAEGDALQQSGSRHTNMLFMWEGDRWVDKASELGLSLGGWSWNAKFADVDNDQWQDIYIVNNHFGMRSRTSHYFYLNRAGRDFVDATQESGLTSYLSEPAYIYTDLDFDGDLDLVTLPLTGPAKIYLNSQESGNAITFQLRDLQGNRFGIGSKILIHYGPGGTLHQMREIQAGGGFFSFGPLLAHFGLAEYESLDRVEVIWSTGERSEIVADFRTGAHYQITRTGSRRSSVSNR